MERGRVHDPMIIDGNGDAAVAAAGSVFPDGEALAEEMQVQEVILLSAFQEMVIQDTSAESIDRLIRENQKQLAPKTPWSSVADPGQSSSSSAAPVDDDEEFYGAICMETVRGILKFSISSCRHVFCLSYIVQYVAARMEENVVRVKCPDPRCGDGAIEPESCRGIFPPELLDKWDLMLCESTLGAKKRLYCPFRDCSAPLLTGEGGEAGTAVAEAVCPHCHWLFCARCVVPWHDGVGCKEFQALGEDERGREDIMVRRLAGRQRWQRCPK